MKNHDEWRTADARGGMVACVVALGATFVTALFMIFEFLI